ncbi:DUF5994 family protein [Mycolicibacter senuensis]|uniref:Uncharacterized protein n=1 Tax=Mycolicibacter senuensis TaxID=386913 RepID=A0A7I9XP97_9MYCO|nr:DUF5994 family protein [Mycolicibacter senuensis]MDQ2628715.1 DUF5994 family protein [Actinomycetota bacterium]ORW69733.1 hypothetical protein AWC24_04925 [Mycolicibacter senuensis]GFG71793.1 hypothetical protein MSEN_35130 [Mycolicibacter senuensis]
MTGTRRSARPIRIALAARLGADIDGAWWPQTASMVNELPGLIAALQRRVGEITNISINWSVTDGSPDLDSMTAAGMARPGWRDKSQRLLIATGRLGRVKLLVVPHLTRAGLGLMLLRRAAEIPIPLAQQEDRELGTADYIIRAARTQSASWADRMADDLAGESHSVPGVHSGHPAPSG